MQILQPGRNCWRIEPVRRLAFLIDGEVCFGAMRQAFVRAEHSIDVLAWDIDSRMRLQPDGADDGLPEQLGPFFDALTRRKRALRVHLLSWDYAMLYAFEREWLPRLKFGARTHPRLSFALDGAHPPGASHHQKVVVVDDTIAFVGGLDPTCARWDTRRHRAHDPRRIDAAGAEYGPFHDVHLLLEGDAARAFGELARARWADATGATRPAPPPRRGSPWPEDLRPDLTDTRIGIARTAPEFGARAAISEIRELLIDSVGAAEKSIYAETQYFTAEAFGNALQERLGDARGPQFVLVSSQNHTGWVQEQTMGVLRARLDREMREADRFGRYRAYYPHIPKLDGCLNVHSKLLTADDRLLVIGSANLNNRSMGLDTEVAVALDSALDPRHAGVITDVRNRLLAEHLGCRSEEVASACARADGLIGAIESLRGDGRSLRPIDFCAEFPHDTTVPAQAVVDPEQPLDADEVLAQIAAGRRRRVRRRIMLGAGSVVVLGLLAALWWGTPLRSWIDVPRLVGLLQRIGDSPLAPLALLAAYAIGGLIVFPINVLIAASVLVFGPLLGATYALAGSLLSAALLYEIGCRISTVELRRRLGPRVQRLSARLARHGVLAIALVRIVPVAPYSLVCVVAGAAHIGRVHYLVGTALGMLPGILMYALFIDRVLAVIEKPSPASYALLVGAIALIVALALALSRRLARAHAAG
jgi:phosphatidylserine/phosphatidylglycerophosphate/cardiolipin synthase-like enzyme/uncharacterized membrane protein YdjX (TVP38/TMEM64 family)